MVRFRKEKKDLNDPLTRWLIWLDKRSSHELLKEVVNMDTDILNAEERLAFLAGDEDMMHLYHRRFMAMCDRTSQMNYARSKGHAEGLAEGEQKIIDLLKSGKTPEEIIRDYGS
jgi:hypothetical protein